VPRLLPWTGGADVFPSRSHGRPGTLASTSRTKGRYTLIDWRTASDVPLSVARYRVQGLASPVSIAAPLRKTGTRLPPGPPPKHAWRRRILVIADGALARNLYGIFSWRHGRFDQLCGASCAGVGRGMRPRHNPVKPTLLVLDFGDALGCTGAGSSIRPQSTMAGYSGFCLLRCIRMLASGDGIGSGCRRPAIHRPKTTGWTSWLPCCFVHCYDPLTCQTMRLKKPRS